MDDEGWLISIKIIDRKNIFKLFQGEYVAPQKIEAIFKCSHSVSEIFTWEDSYQNFLVAIVMLRWKLLNNGLLKNIMQT